MFAKRLFAARAYIEALILTVMQFAYLMVEVADAATRRIGLTRHLAIALEKFMQRLYHLIKIEAAARAALRRFYNRQSARRMTRTYLAPSDKRMTIPRRALYIIIAQGSILQVLHNR